MLFIGCENKYINMIWLHKFFFQSEFPSIFLNWAIGRKKEAIWLQNALSKFCLPFLFF